MKQAIPPIGRDPRFKPKERACGLCGQKFTTSPLRRYFCRSCWINTNKHGKISTEYPAPRSKVG